MAVVARRRTVRNAVWCRFVAWGRDCPSWKPHAAAQPSRPPRSGAREHGPGGPRAGLYGENGVGQWDERQARPHVWM